VSSANKSRGFTLVEIAIVLVIVGLILGTLAPLMVGLIKKDKLEDGRQTVQRARDEIIGYAMINSGRLPANISAISHNVDPWDEQLILITAPGLSSSSVCSANSTSLGIIIYRAAGGGACSSGSLKQDVAFVILSKGPDYNRQISAPASGRVAILDYGCTGDLYLADNNGVGSNRPFDDIYDYVSLQELKARLCTP